MDGTVVLTDGTTREMEEGETLYPGSEPIDYKERR
jgi:hypothetical protein